MKISPRELREAQIPSKAFGFNQDVVDALLERAADTIEGLIEENRQLFEALERMRNEGTSTPVADPFEGVEAVAPPEPVEVIQETVAPAVSIDENLLIAQMSEKEGLINKTLLLAQKTADETLKTAKEQAAELVETAQANADELVANAKAEAESVSGSAKEQAQKDLEEAQLQAQGMVEAAQGQADELISTSKAQAEEMVATAQSQADSIHSSEREKFVALVAQLTQERAQLLSDIEVLQDFDSTHRNKLREIVENDLEVLVQRPPLDIGAIPTLPIIDEIAPAPASTPTPIETIQEEKVVAHSELPVTPTSFDEAVEEVIPVVEPATSEDFSDEILISDDFEVEALEEVEAATSVESAAKYESEDPFAAFVDAPSVVAPAGDIEEDVEPRVAPTVDVQVESAGSTTTFDPGVTSKPNRQETLDDDDFFASLREAVADDAPLGPSEDDDNDGGVFKGLFKK